MTIPQAAHVCIFPGGQAGMALYSYKLANALTKYCRKVSLLVDDAYELNHAPTRFHLVKVLSSRNVYGALARNRLLRIFNILFSHLYNWYQLFYFIRKDSADIVHLQPQFYIVDWLAVVLLKVTGKKVVVTVHDAIPHSYYTSLTGVEKKLLQCIYCNTDKLIVHADANRVKLLETYPIRDEKVVVIPHGEYSLNGISTPVTETDARNFLKLAPGQKVILFFGFIRKNKGLEILLHAFEVLAEKDMDAVLVVAGALIQGATFTPYESTLSRMKHANRVRVFARYIAHEEIPLFFLPADVVALPYLEFGSQSGVAHLATGFGKPVVASCVGGLPELFEDGKTGFLVPPGDVKKLSDALYRLLQDNTLRKDMGRQAYMVSSNKYTWDSIAKSTAEKAYVS
jgi:glycosyltransferase involved in cell wall biosynthesis